VSVYDSEKKGRVIARCEIEKAELETTPQKQMVE